MSFEFDEAKNSANIKKHGLSLEFGRLVFEDQERRIFHDNRKNYGEDRFQCYGMVPANSICGRVFIVVYTLRGGNIRIISVRKANAREQNRYYQS